MTASEFSQVRRLAIGEEILDGRLVVRSVLGSGAMGVVYCADDRTLGRPVALKTLANFGAEQLYHLKREHRTLTGFSHRNLVQVYELGVAGDLWFLIMELVDGVNLSRWLRQKPGLARVTFVLAELAEGIRALHTAGVMHRDIKPANVMVTPDDHAVLLDFGLAVPLRGTAPTLSAGTLDYVAPEQLWDESPGAPADWYSFGVVLFEALSGTLPFAGADRLKAMVAGPTAGPRAFAPDIPVPLDTLTRRLLSPDPMQRPGAAEVASVLGTREVIEKTEPIVESQFVGRADTLQALHGLLAGVDSGAPQVVHVHGPSGIGKTALARKFISQAQLHRDVLVLEGKCHPQESVPYKALDALIDNLGRHLLGLDHRSVLALAPRSAGALLHLFPVLGRVPAVRDWPVKPVDLSPSELRRRGFDALREVLTKLADKHSLILWIDDIQWSDRDSGVVLQALLAPPDAPALLLLLTSRDDDQSGTLLSALPAATAQTDIALGPLSEAESLDLAQSLARAAGLDADLNAVATEASGSPFLLGELVRYLGEGAKLSADRTFTVEDALSARFDNLHADGRHLLEIIAVAGGPLEIDLALEVSGLGAPGRLLAYSLCSEHLLRQRTQDNRSWLEPYHDRLRDYMVTSLGPEVKRAHHRALARAIDASRTPDTRALTWHCLEAQDFADAARFALIAAQQAERDLAFDQAVDMYAIALEHGPGGVRDVELMSRRARMLAYGARRLEAALAYEDAARALDRRESRTTLRVQAAEQFLYGGDLKQGVRVLEDVLTELGVRIPVSAWGRAFTGLWYRARFIARGSRVYVRETQSIGDLEKMRLDALWRTTRGLVMLDPVLADVLAGMHLLESLRSGDISRALRALVLEAAIEANIGGRWFRQRSRRLLAEAEHTVTRHGDAYDAAWLAQSRAVCAFCEGRWSECVDLGRLADARMRKTGQDVAWDLAALHGFMLSALANLGRLPELKQRVDELVLDAERRHDQYALRVFQTGDAVLIWLADDQVGKALQLADETLRDYQLGQFTSQHRHHLVATVQSHLYAGDAPAAWDRVERAWPSLRRSGFLLMDCLGTQLRYLKACAAVAMAREASSRSKVWFLRAARHEVRRINRSELSMAPPMSHAIEAAIAGATGRGDAQVVHLIAAVDGFDAAEMHLHREAARWHLGGVTETSEHWSSSIAWMAQQGIVRPDLMARAIVPGVQRQG